MRLRKNKENRWRQSRQYRKILFIQFYEPVYFSFLVRSIIFSFKVNKYPWMVAILDEKINWTVNCGGTLVASKYVITAASCLDLAIPSEIKAGQRTFQTKKIKILLLSRSK